MRSLIWKEWRENLRWVPLPGLVILLVFLIDTPGEPMFATTDAYYFCLIAVVFGAAMGFVQIFFEGHGDKRSILMHRPLSPSRIFLAKVIAGVSLYALALGIPFMCLESWLATPGNIGAPFHWRTSLPWLADILSGLVYYFAGMLTAQREARWFGSRCLGLAAAFFCSYLVWALPEFWQALLAIAIMSFFVGVAAWGSFRTGGAYAVQPRLARAALGMTMVFGLLILSMMGKQLIGEWFDPGMHYQVDLDAQGQVLFSTHKEGSGTIAVTDLNGQDYDRKGLRSWGPTFTMLDWPVHSGYRHNSRFYVGYHNDSKPGHERWYFDQAQGRLLGYDGHYHHFLGSFGPDGFTPPDEQPGERFSEKLRYGTNRWQFMSSGFLVFPDGAYVLDYAQRSIRKLYAAAPGESVRSACEWHQNSTRTVVVVSTDKAFHILTEAGSPVVSLPRAFDGANYGPIFVGRFENPDRYFVWHHLRLWLREPEEYMSEPGHLFEYDDAGNELAHRTVPPFPYPATSYADALFGLVTPMTEAASLVGATRYMRFVDRSNGSDRKSSLNDYLEGIQYYIPGTSTLATTLSPATQPPSGMIQVYIALILMSAGASALYAMVLARRYAFSRARRIGWALVCFIFGWIGLVLMLILQDWPARVACPKCRKLRVVTLDTCEHCGALHARPALDGTEIFALAQSAPQVALSAS